MDFGEGQGAIATPHGALPAGIVAVTVLVFRSMTDTSSLRPLAVKARVPSAPIATCQTR